MSIIWVSSTLVLAEALPRQATRKRLAHSDWSTATGWCPVQVNVAKLARRLLLAGTLALALALGANRLLWGYWGLWPPSLCRTVAGRGAILEGATLLRLADRSPFQRVLDGKKVLDASEWVKEQIPVSEGFEKWVSAFSGDARREISGLPDSVVRDLWTLAKAAEGDLASSNEYRDSAGQGWLLLLKIRSGISETLLLAHQTSEVANDRCYYAESAFTTNGEGYSLRARAEYWFEISRREWFDFPHLLIVSVAAVATVWLITASLAVAVRRGGGSRAGVVSGLKDKGGHGVGSAFM